MTDPDRKQIAENVSQVRARIAAAAARGGRSADEITLVAVSKYVPAATSRLLFEAGCQDLGESRPQQLWEKAEQLDDVPDLRWHMIGHLQRNKVAKTLPLVHLIHSIDSERLWKAIANEAQKQNRTIDALVEVNISGDETKHGFKISELEGSLESHLETPGVHVRGFMAMASREGGIETAARDFEAMRRLQEKLQQRFGEQFPLQELSMGMSGDFETAIEHGATIVRVGSALTR